MEEQDSQYTFQEYAIALMCETIKMCKRNGDGRNMLESYGSKNTFKSGLIAHYASMYYLKDEKRYINFWQNNIKYSDALLMSNKAKKIIGVINNDYNGSLNKYKNDPQNKKDDARLYWEHITPNEVVWQRYLNVFDHFSQTEPSEEDLKQEVEKCFNGHKLALITKAEAAALDQNGRTGNKHTGGCKPNENISKFNDIAAMRIKEIRDRLVIPKRFGTIEDYLESKNFII